MAELKTMRPFGIRNPASAGHWRQTMDERWFRKRRATYFFYLSGLLEGLQGSRTLRDVFADDVLRYGAGHPRGRLALWWIRRYEVSGGSLFEAWRGCVPQRERLAIRAAQSLGNAALGQVLSELARVVRLEDKSRAQVHSALLAAWGALAVVSLVLVCIPVFSVPRLLDTFSTVPAAHYGPATQGLLIFTLLLQNSWWGVLGTLSCLYQLVRWSLPAYCGSLRPTLDRIPPWSLYRQRHALSFLFMLQLALQSQDTSRVRLRQVLVGQRTHANAWADKHLQRMLVRIDGGAVGASIFDTGLLDREYIWLLDDMVRARGMSGGLHLTAAQLELRLMESIHRQALVLRWLLLLSCVLLILGGVLWHYVVIDEFRKALMLLHS